MPFFRLGTTLVYFAHVPKCGGTSVERALGAAGLSLSFVDPQWWHAPHPRWAASSPQHIRIADLHRLVDPALFDHSFAVLRDPVARFLSAFNHNREAGRIAFHISPGRFADMLAKDGDHFGARFDNHFVPASALVPPGARTFRLEDGLDPVATWLGTITGVALPLRFDHANRRSWNAVHARNPVARHVKRLLQPVIPPPDRIDGATRARIVDLYRADYRRFGLPMPADDRVADRPM